MTLPDFQTSHQRTALDVQGVDTRIFDFEPPPMIFILGSRGASGALPELR